LIPRALFSSELEDFRTSFRRFLEQEVLPQHDAWEEQQCVSREIWKRAGELGFLCVTMPEQYGGAGVDRRYGAVMIEEQSYSGASGLGFSLHSDIVANYLNNFGNEAQKKTWLPRMARGEIIGAIAMTEPGTGSDLQAIRTTAVAQGDHYVLNGAKTFITNGYLSDLVIVVARTGGSGSGSKDLSLLLVETSSKGFSKGRPLRKIGMKAQDTCELFFDNVVVPRANLLGAEGSGFAALMRELAWERLIIAITAVAATRGALDETIRYTQQRKVFGQPVAAFQNSRFKLADMKAELAIGQVYVDRCLEQMLAAELSADDAAIAKLWCTEMQGRVIDQCVQLHGGNGYMLEYPVARHYIDCRAQRIYGGTNEIMREIIARTL
jgi:alkylation response protein AidB-like acyl-CoA dehydrogenase